jgi:predicted SAM-dependent methyltransferase
MWLKERFVRMTHREGLLYDLVYGSALGVSRYMYRIRYGHFVRRSILREYLKTHSTRRLHLGAGKINVEGYLNTDLYGRIPIDITKRLPFPDECIDTIVSNHVVEHVYRRQFVFFLHEATRVLRSGGRMWIGTPSFEKMARAMYCDGESTARRAMLAHLQRKVEVEGETVTAASYLNDNTHRLFMHRYIYDLETMRDLGKLTGFRSIESVTLNEITEEGVQEALPEPGSYRDLQSETFLFQK